MKFLVDRLLIGNLTNMIGGTIWKGKFLILQNLVLRQYGYLRQLIHSQKKVQRNRECGSVLLLYVYVAREIYFKKYTLSGYLPQNLYSLDSSYGSDYQLRSLIQKMQQHRVRAMADIVINHRVGTARGHGGSYNRYDGIPLSWNEHAVTSCSGGLVSLFLIRC